MEVWHRILKSGCRIEARQLETAERLRRCLALYSVLAWRILYATMLARSVPKAPCSVLLDPEEWQALYCAIHRVPHQGPRACLNILGGGFLVFEPTFKGVWSTAVNFAPFLPPDTRHGQYPRHPRRSNEKRGCHAPGGCAARRQRSAQAAPV